MKRHVRCSTDDYYTNFIDELLPEPVSVFMETEFSSNPFEDGQKQIIMDAIDAYWEDYKKIDEYDNPRRYRQRAYYSLEEDQKRTDRDKYRFYQKYRAFAQKCKEVEDIIRATGYGMYDYFNIRLKEMLRGVDYRFPYGWKVFR